ncbi:MAG: hypothetical protein FWG31_04295 [Oscillospiraceae bacterium]|nr:hypothetical protein [Oscillospiraceae bacterium]
MKMKRLIVYLLVTALCFTVAPFGTAQSDICNPAQNSIDVLKETNANNPDVIEFTFYVTEESKTRSSATITHEITLTLSKVDNNNFHVAAYQEASSIFHLHPVSLSFDVKVWSKVPQPMGNFRFTLSDLSPFKYPQGQTFYYPDWGAVQITNLYASGGGCFLAYSTPMISIGS